MLYSEYIIKAAEITIEEADNGLCYLQPMWKSYLLDNEMGIDEISDLEVSWTDILNTLKLEVEKRNTVNSLQPYIHTWLHDIITATVEPAITQAENDFIKNLTDYLKANKEAQTLKE